MNNILKLKITGITSDGDGIARSETHGVIFVSRALPGEIITAKIFERHKDFALAKIIEINQAHPERVTPRCEHYYKCGGCQLQHASYNLQLKLKAMIVKDAMTRLGGFNDFNFENLECVASPKEFGYRNKAAFPVQAAQNSNHKNQKLVTGFYRAGTHRIEPVKNCPVNDDALNEMYQSILGGLNDLNLDGYKEEDNTGKLRHIIMRTGQHTKQNLLSFVINGKLSAKAIKSLIALGNKTKPDTITINHNSRPGNTILGNHTESITGNGIIAEQLDKYTLNFDTTSFFQVNTLQAENLFKYAASLVDGAKSILELYSGVGSLTCYLADKCEHVTSIEDWRSAVKMAKRNLRLNNLGDRVNALCGKSEELIEDLELRNYDAVVLDPPRDGCNRAVLNAIKDMNINKIVYVSCNPATLARDCKILRNFNYNLKSIKAFDMFPQTAHVETVAMLEKF
ncbi:MAG: 23S rRNA (uracil(1939)-C(5))-methyltransferase RlmD [Synergistaceae bacterium]|nr:23S rRNA (uracil(1939)-C(5))-methyltransferase RlmD [Synergistaceae bacterium]